MITREFFFTDGVVSKSVTTDNLPSPASKTDRHHCPRCGSYFYGRYEGFQNANYWCGRCGYTYPRMTDDELRSMKEADPYNGEAE